MLALTPEQRAAIAKGQVARRLFVYCEALSPDGLTPDPAGFWDDVGDVTVAGRLYHGSGAVVTVGNLSLVGDLSVPGLAVTLSGLDNETAALVRGSTVEQRPIDLKVGVIDTDTRLLVGPLIPRFKGKVDDVEIKTPEASGPSTVVLTCESTSRGLTIRRHDTRSRKSAHERDPQDDIYQYTGAQREKPLYFGRKAPR